MSQNELQCKNGLSKMTGMPEIDMSVICIPNLLERIPANAITATTVE